jgi:hypothetical protein
MPIDSILDASFQDLSEAFDDFQSAQFQNPAQVLSRFVVAFDAEPLAGFLSSALPMVDFETCLATAESTRGGMAGLRESDLSRGSWRESGASGGAGAPSSGKRAAPPRLCTCCGTVVRAMLMTEPRRRTRAAASRTGARGRESRGRRRTQAAHASPRDGGAHEFVRRRWVQPPEPLRRTRATCVGAARGTRRYL